MNIRTKIARIVRALSTLAILLLFFVTCVRAQNATPLGGVGSLQFFDNNGAPLINGVVYIYVAGTTTQASVYTDATATTLQPNPVTFGSGARSSIWLANSTFVKIILCAQNDGPFCAPGDILFSADQVPIGSSSSGGGGSSPFTGIFISSTASPATSGVLRLASGDSICFRNAAGSSNICFSKTSGDILQWAGGSIQFPEIVAPTCGAAGFDCLWADSTAHRFKAVSNGGTAAQFVLSGIDINTTDQVTQLHFGSTATPLGAAPTTNQVLQWNGTNITGLTVTSPVVFALTSNVNAGVGLTNITGMSFAVTATQNYRVICKLFISSGAGITHLTWTGPAAPTLVMFGADAQAGGFSAAFGATQQIFGAVSAEVLVPQFMVLLNGANAGTVQLQTDNNSIVYSGSYCTVINQ